MRLRVPHESGCLLSEPALARLPALVSANREYLARTKAVYAGQPLRHWQSLARWEALQQNQRYCQRLGTPAAVAQQEDGPWIVTGHQPELFHPGVWIKSPATYRLAEQVHGIGWHILADGDVARTSTMRVPTGNARDPLLTFVPFDRSPGDHPWEEWFASEEALVAAFPERVAEEMAGYSFTPLVKRWWRGMPRAAQARAKALSLGERFAAGRQALEQTELGLHNRELPLSDLCQTESFAWFGAGILHDIERFVTFYNAALRDYQQRNGIRGSHHPVPPLAHTMIEGAEEWETPFWAYSRAQPRRARLLARLAGERLELWANGTFIASLRRQSWQTLAEDWRGGLGAWKIRPRALMTTLFLRLFLADLFLHGIGGGKYDELTDELSRRWLGFAPPPFAILSATLLLPTGVETFEAARLQAQQARLRDLLWNPDRYVDDYLREQEPVAEWIERKFTLMDQSPRTPRERVRRFEEFRQLNQQLRAFLGDDPLKTKRVLDDLTQQQRRHALLANREFAACLHPLSSITRLFELIKFPAS